MRKTTILSGLLAATVVCSLALASGRKDVFVEKVYQQEGDTRLPVAVTCNHDSWVQVLPARAIRRNALLQSLTSATLGVCISTITTQGYACGDTTPGVELGPGDSYTEYSEAILYCRSRPSTSEKLKGMEFYDSGD